jgi:hypothetical protein
VHILPRLVQHIPNEDEMAGKTSRWMKGYIETLHKVADYEHHEYPVLEEIGESGSPDIVKMTETIHQMMTLHETLVQRNAAGDARTVEIKFNLFHIGNVEDKTHGELLGVLTYYFIYGDNDRTSPINVSRRANLRDMTNRIMRTQQIFFAEDDEKAHELYAIISDDVANLYRVTISQYAAIYNDPRQ